ncbi:MAG: hypothetical protein RSC26_03430 [Terrisporobacter sp.]
MIRQKNLYMANFNCTFGDDHSPMLDYFEKIILPSFTNDYKKITSRNTFFFYNVKIIEYLQGKFALSGIIVKKTILEVKSLHDEKTQNLIRKDERIPSDPFSYFTIFLDNHRMVLVKNQSGSPSLKDFERLSQYALKEAVIESESMNNKLTISLNIGSLPSSNKVDEAIDKIAEIQQVVLKLYPLNGDIDDLYGGLREELIKLGCDEGFATYKNPQNTSEVRNTLKQSKGIFKPTVRGKGRDGEKITITDNSVASVLPIRINEDVNIDENISNILDQVQDREELKELSNENRDKYEEKKNILEKLMDLFR